MNLNRSWPLMFRTKSGSVLLLMRRDGEQLMTIMMDHSFSRMDALINRNPRGDYVQEHP